MFAYPWVLEKKVFTIVWEGKVNVGRSDQGHTGVFKLDGHGRPGITWNSLSNERMDSFGIMYNKKRRKY